MLNNVVKYATISTAISVGLYATLLGLLTTSWFQAHVVYLHKIQMTWFKDLSVPESLGFLRGQVTLFTIATPAGSKLFAWHILPLELYRQHEKSLVAESTTQNITSGLNFELLREDPEARLVIHLHGAAGTVASGYRVPNYRALSAGQPKKIHVLAFDYRGFGYSQGTPSERGLCSDAIAVFDWAMKTAGIPPSRILIFSQSLGTTVGLAVVEHYAMQSPPIVFAGSILVAPFVDVATLVATYRIGGTVPLLSPLARFPTLFNYLRTLITDRWSSKDRIASYIRTNEANKRNYQLTLLHAEDDYDIPSQHTPVLFWHAINAMVPQGISQDEVEERKLESRTDLGPAGSVMEWRTKYGVVREEILKTGLHDVIMGNPVVSLAVMRILTTADPSFQ